MRPLSVFRHEWGRISRQRTAVLLILLVAVLTIPLCAIVNTANRLTAYDRLSRMAAEYPEAERESFLEDYTAKIGMEMMMEWPDEETRQACAELVSAGRIPTDFYEQRDYEKEAAHVLQDLQGIRNYANYLADIQLQSKKMSLLTKLSASRDYNQANIDKTAADYRVLEDVRPVWDTNAGVMLFQQTVPGLGWLLCIGTLLLGLVVYTAERPSLQLLKSMKKGTASLTMSKLLTLLLLTAGMTLLAAAAALLFCGILYGFGDLSRPVQSVFMSCPYRISVMQFLGYRTLLLLLVECRAAFTAFLLCMVLSRMASVTFAAILAITAGAVVRMAVSGFSPLGFLRTSSLFCGLSGETDPAVYQNVNCFGTPVPLIRVYIVISLVMMVLAGLLILRLSFLMPASGRRVRLRRAGSRRKDGAVPAGKLASQQTWRHLIGQRGIAVCVLAPLLAVMCVFVFPERMNISEWYLRPVIEKAQAQSDPGAWLEEELDKAGSEENRNSMRYYALENAAEMYRRAEDNREQGAEFLFGGGYERLIDGTFRSNGFLVMALAVILFNVLTARESIDGLLDTMPEGLRKRKRYTFLCRGAVILLVYLTAVCAEFIQIGSEFSLPSPTAGAVSLEILWKYPAFSIAGILVLLQAARLAILCLVSLVLTRLGRRGQIVQLAVSMVFVVLPLILLRINVLSFFR